MVTDTRRTNWILVFIALLIGLLVGYFLVDRVVESTAEATESSLLLEMLSESDVVLGLAGDAQTIVVLDGEGSSLAGCCTGKACEGKDLPVCDEGILQFFEDKKEVLAVKANVEAIDTKQADKMGAVGALSLVGEARAQADDLDACILAIRVHQKIVYRYPDPCDPEKNP